jgi:hypothetical protein
VPSIKKNPKHTCNTTIAPNKTMQQAEQGVRRQVKTGSARSQNQLKTSLVLRVLLCE